ncbi:MAG: amino acid permease [Planctomycetes bacterium]|nr:amino acid permease [Planctomycetota bacterium]
MTASLRRRLGLAAVLAVVMGDMLGSGIFFTPGELAAHARRPWDVYLLWGLCGAITLCGALTLAELATRLPQAGASYAIIREAFGPFPAFLKVWLEAFVSGPGSVAGIALAFGEFASRALGTHGSSWPVGIGLCAIVVLTAVNLLGVEWGGRTQVVFTAIKILGIVGLVIGGLFIAAPAPATHTSDDSATNGGALAFLRMVGAGVAIVLFTYDGWIDVTHVAGEVIEPQRTLPRGLAFGVTGIIALYLLVNAAFLRVVPLAQMREQPTTIATTVAGLACGRVGGTILNGLMLVSIFGAFGGLLLTLPRLVYAGAKPLPGAVCRAIASVSPRTGAPRGAIVFCAVTAIAVLVVFQSIPRLAQFIVVPLQASTILVVASVFRLRRRVTEAPSPYRTPGYPVVPLVYCVVLGALLVSTLVVEPLDSLRGVALTATGIPVYFWLARAKTRKDASA